MLTERYDAALVAYGSTGGSSFCNAALKLAERARLAELDSDTIAELTAQHDRFVADDRAHRQQLLDYPPVGWGASSPSYEERREHWRTRPEQDRVRDPREREVQ